MIKETRIHVPSLPVKQVLATIYPILTSSFKVKEECLVRVVKRIISRDGDAFDLNMIELPNLGEIHITVRNPQSN